MPIDDEGLTAVTSLVRDSFRVHEDDDIVYVDIQGRLNRVASAQHQVIFGRRGSGKSSLLVSLHQQAPELGLLSIYLNADRYKKLSYPDMLIRLLLSIFESIPGSKPGLLGRAAQSLHLRRPTALQSTVAELRLLLDKAEDVEVTDRQRSARDSSIKGTASIPQGLGGSASIGEQTEAERISAFSERKFDQLGRHIEDYRSALKDGLRQSGATKAALIVDDFYLIPRSLQPDVIDYLHQLCRGTRLYLKVGTIRHRTSLVRQNAGQTIGVEFSEDIEVLDLDQTFEDMARTTAYLAEMLDLMGEQVGVPAVSTDYVSQDGLQALTLASGGVPRDYLTTFVEAVDFARAGRGASDRWLTPATVYKGGARMAYLTKLTKLREDSGYDSEALERVLESVVDFCLQEKRKTAFLVSQEEARANAPAHELIMQLMDFKLIHVIEPNTSAASGRPGRYEAYTLDTSFFMEPRKRGIDRVEFWKTDEQRRRLGVREAPVYPLTTATAAAARTVSPQVEQVIERIALELPDEPDDYEDPVGHS